jgi:phosphoglycolate phosphatase-like HAD superfamily hydrolase
MRFKVIILDFDGTIVESVGIKDAAFEELFKAFPEHLNAIMEYHLSHNATVRFEKFEFIYENIFRLPYSKNIRECLSQEFSDLVFEKIVRCSFVLGAKEFLDYFWGKVPLYLASASPAEELIKIIEARDIKKYFQDVYAIPWVKTDVVGDILKREDVSLEEAVFIGDAFEDLEAARLTGISFIGRDSKKSFHGADIPLYENMFDIREFLFRM